MRYEIEDLELDACLYWPLHLSDIVAEISLLPILLKTQDQFLSILKSSDRSPSAWRTTLEASSSLSANLFLKHLMVLSDFGGERLQRISKDFAIVFPDNKMEFVWNSEVFTHEFSKKRSSWSNKKLNVEKSVILKECALTDDMYDVAMLLMWGSNIIHNPNIPIEMIDKCNIGNLIGKLDELDLFVKQRYIQVSRITGGSTANDLGHACEDYVRDALKKNLGENFEIKDHTVPGISHNDKDLTTFDIVVNNIATGVYFAIEVSFQVTTNSTIERKAGLAQSRKELLNQKGHKVLYVIDGSGNFQRRNAIKTILTYSDLAVNFSDKGIQTLIDYIKEGND